MRRLVIPVLALVAAGCAAPRWTQVGGPYRSEKENFTIEIPSGWMRFGQADHLVITRDGLSLQAIFVGRLAAGNPLPDSQKIIRKGMLPQEAANAILDSFATDQRYRNFEIVENVPVKIAGFDGFRVVFTHRTGDGLRKRDVYYGFLAGDWYYFLRYSAASRHYFDRDAGTFERVVESFRLVKS